MQSSRFDAIPAGLSLQRGTAPCCLVLAAVLWSAPLSAQTTHAQITGLVTDSTGASIPGAAISAVNANTQVESLTETNLAGVYVIPQLVAGPYEVTASSEGFDTVIQRGITLRSGDRQSLNFVMTVGTLAESIEVVASAQLLTLDEASHSSVIDNTIITSMPQLQRDTLAAIAQLNPAVQGNDPQLLGEGWDVAIAVNGVGYSLAGGQANGTAISVDGAMVQDAEVNVVNRAIPSPDSVQEFRVQTGVLPANVGRYSGGVITISSQSGTNELHGRLFYYHRNEKFNSNGFMNNALGNERQPFRQHNYGFSVGGPVVLPKAYDGRNRTFFFLGWEDQRFRSSSSQRASVPTATERGGDFSQSIINFQEGRPVFARIFDPYSGYEGADGAWIRPEFPNAIVPVAHRTQVGRSILASMWPEANRSPDANTSSGNNFEGIAGQVRPVARLNLRVDQSITPNQRIYGRFSRFLGVNENTPLFPTRSHGSTNDNNWQSSLNYTWSISPTTIVQFTGGSSVSKMTNFSGMDFGTGINTDQWGFDPFIFSPGYRRSPEIAPSVGGAGYSSAGGGTQFKITSQNLNGDLSLSKIVGRHSLKAGYQYFWSMSVDEGSNLSGMTRLSAGGGSNQFWDNNDGLSGNALAEYLLGSTVASSWGIWNITPVTQSHAVYVMDDWKVSNDLTLQLGVRWDYETGRTPRYQNTGTFLDLDAKNVVTPNAEWNWGHVQAAVPAVGSFPDPVWLSQGANGRMGLMGTPEYPRKSLYDTEWANFTPRIGVSYAFNPKTVIHAGFGVVYQGFNGLNSEGLGSYFYNSVGFDQIPTLDGRRWISEIGTERGLGAFPRLPDGTNLGWQLPAANNEEYLRATLGSCISVTFGICTGVPSPLPSPFETVFSASIQRELSRAWVVSFEYNGIRSSSVLNPVAPGGAAYYRYTNIDPSYYSLGTDLLKSVPNPFFGQSSRFDIQPTVPLHQLLSPWPHYTSAGPAYLTNGRLNSNFYNFKIQTRQFAGLLLDASYAFRQSKTNAGAKDMRLMRTFLQRSLHNPQDLNESYGWALHERPHTVLLNYHYELPIGRGQRFLGSPSTTGARVLNAIVGGWGLAGVTTWWSKGTPVLAPVVSGAVSAPGAAVRWSSNGDYMNGSRNDSSALVVQGSFTEPNPQGAFNRGAYVRTGDYQFGNLPYIYEDVRHPGALETDATIMKDFYITEDVYFNLRLEALNFFNHANFGRVITDPDSPLFGGVSGKNGQRIMQIGLRLFF